MVKKLQNENIEKDYLVIIEDRFGFVDGLLIEIGKIPTYQETMNCTLKEVKDLKRAGVIIDFKEK
jgi:hypothetical protein